MSPAPARLFVALEIPSAARAALARWCGEQLDGVPGLRPIEAGTMHVTLCFLGSRPLVDVEAIGAACRRLADGPPVVLSLGPIGWLPRSRPRALALELEDREGGLAGLQARVSRALAAGGWYEPERRPFLAHVTLARVARRVRVAGLKIPAPAPLSFPGDELSLFRSSVGQRPAGGYERLVTARLTDR